MKEDVKRLLVREAIQAREKAYAPYSGYTVGAALISKDSARYHEWKIRKASV